MEHSRRPVRSLAILLACLAPGLGQLYLGRRVRGLVLLIVGLAFVPITVVAAHLEPSGTTIWTVIIAGALALLALVLGLIDASRVSPHDGLQAAASHRFLAFAVACFVCVGLVAGVGGALWIRANLLEAFKIPTSSMAPTIEPGDRILVNKRTTWDRPLQRGDLIVYVAPDGSGHKHVKRVIGLGGETVQMRGTAAAIDGRLLAGDELPQRRAPAGHERFADGVEIPVEIAPGTENAPEILVPPGHCFVLGDDRKNSRDSRHYGVVSLDDIQGLVVYRFWPLGRVGVVK